MRNTTFNQIEDLIRLGVLATGKLDDIFLFFDQRKHQYDIVRFWDTWLPKEEYEKNLSLFASLGLQAAQGGKLTYLTHVYAIGFVLWKSQYASDRFSICELDVQQQTQIERVYSVAYAGAEGILRFCRLRKRTLTVPYLRVAAQSFLRELRHIRHRQGAGNATLAELDSQMNNLHNDDDT